MKDMLIVVFLLVLIGGIVFYLWRGKKRGVQCVGCPCARQCAGKCGGSRSGPEEPQ